MKLPSEAFDDINLTFIFFRCKDVRLSNKIGLFWQIQSLEAVCMLFAVLDNTN